MQRQLDDNTRWQAVLERDAAYDGQFVYAVHSTHIYCRPSCPSRRPAARRNVAFYTLPAAAEQAGFRPCRRCRPQQAHVQDEQAALMQLVCEYIREHIDESLTLERLGAVAGLSPAHLQRSFRRVVGITPRQYTAACREQRLRAGLQAGQRVTDAAYEAGYSSSSRLHAHSSRLGTTPSDYRSGGQNMEIHYSVSPCPLGQMLVAASERGICRVMLGGDADALVARLRDEYPAAQHVEDSEGLGNWVAVLLDYLSGWQPRLDLPLDIRATAFQQRVWEELQRIPYGQTRSYAQIAAAIGQPAAVRAVGSACGANPVAPIIPCHRVLRSDGSLGGYAWGLERKAALLELERSPAPEPA